MKRLFFALLVLINIALFAQKESLFPEFVPYIAEKENDNLAVSNTLISEMGKEQPARWLSVDPLADKYPGWSPYIYTLNNPLLFIDPDGRGVFVNGDDADETVSEINQGLSFELRRDTENGLLSAYDSDGMPIASIGEYDGIEGTLLKAILSTKVQVELLTTNANFDDNGVPIFTGVMEGSESILGGNNVWATNLFNISHAEGLAQVGGGSIGNSALHEIFEASYAGKNFPGQKYVNSNSEPFLSSHEYAKNQTYNNPNVKGYIDRINGWAGYRNVKTGDSKRLYKTKLGMFR